MPPPLSEEKDVWWLDYNPKAVSQKNTQRWLQDIKDERIPAELSRHQSYVLYNLSVPFISIISQIIVILILIVHFSFLFTWKVKPYKNHRRE